MNFLPLGLLTESQFLEVYSLENYSNRHSLLLKGVSLALTSQ